MLESIVASSSSAKLASLKMARNFFHLSLSFVKNPPLFPSRFYTQPSSSQQLQWLAKLVLLESVATIKMEPRQSHALCSSLNYAVSFTIRFERREEKGRDEWVAASQEKTRVVCATCVQLRARPRPATPNEGKAQESKIQELFLCKSTPRPHQIEAH